MQIPFLNRLLSSLDVNVNSFAVCEVRRGFSLALEPMKAPLVHYVVRGFGVLRLDGNAELPVRAHDFVVLPPQRAHWIEVPDGPATEVRGSDHCTALADGMLRFSATEGKAAEIVTTCGIIEATYAGTLGLFDNLPEPISIHLSEGTPLRRAVEALLYEIAEPKLGSDALSEAILKQCLVLLVRELASDPAQAEWLFGKANPRLLQPVLAMVENPANDFSLEGLAELAGMSRSGFAAQFSAAFGQPPIDFLRSIRLRRAARLLEKTDLPVALIAGSIGYESRTYFSRAFRAEFSLDPRAYRARRRRMPL